MELDAYVKALLRRWYFISVFIGLGILGTWVYFEWRSMPSAEAKVAVFETVVTRALDDGTQAQISYESIVESRSLSERVVDKLGEDLDADALQGRISVKLARTLVPSVPSPLYLVKVKDPDEDRAVRLADAVVEESRLMFIELNTLTGEDIQSAFGQTIAEAQLEVDDARDALNAFVRDNGAYALPTQIQAQQGLVARLEELRISSDVAQQAIAQSVAAEATSLQNTLDRANSELRRLAALEPEYNRLAFDVSLAEDQVRQLEATVANVQLGGEDAAEALSIAQEQLAEARARLQDTRAELSSFEQANSIVDLPVSIDNQTRQVATLRQDLASATVATSSFGGAIQTERATLDRLMALEPSYNELNARLVNAENDVRLLKSSVLDATVQSILPANAQVKVLDSAAITSSFWWTIIAYTLGVMLGIFLALLIIYVLAYIGWIPERVDQAEAMVGAPVLTRVPKAF